MCISKIALGLTDLMLSLNQAAFGTLEVLIQLLSSSFSHEFSRLEALNQSLMKIFILDLKQASYTDAKLCSGK